MDAKVTLRVSVEGIDGLEGILEESVEGPFVIRPYMPEIMPPLKVLSFKLESENRSYFMRFTEYGQIKIMLDEVFRVVYLDLEGEEQQIEVNSLLVDLPFLQESAERRLILQMGRSGALRAEGIRERKRAEQARLQQRVGEPNEWTVYGEENIGPARWKKHFLFNWPDRSGPPLQVIMLNVDPWTYKVSREHAGWLKYMIDPRYGGSEFKITYFTYEGYGPPTEHTTMHEITVPYFFAKFDIE